MSENKKIERMKLVDGVGVDHVNNSEKEGSTERETL